MARLISCWSTTDRRTHSIMPLHFVVSQKGSKLLKLNGFLYNKQRINKDSVVWKCSQNWKNKCPGLLYTDSENPEGMLFFKSITKNN